MSYGKNVAHFSHLLSHWFSFSLWFVFFLFICYWYTFGYIYIVYIYTDTFSQRYTLSRRGLLTWKRVIDNRFFIFSLKKLLNARIYTQNTSFSFFCGSSLIYTCLLIAIKVWVFSLACFLLLDHIFLTNRSLKKS